MEKHQRYLYEGVEIWEEGAEGHGIAKEKVQILSSFRVFKPRREDKGQSVSEVS